MLKKILFVLIGSLFAVNIACTKTDTTNANVSGNAAVNVNMPPEFSASPVPVTNMPAGIPDPNSNSGNFQRGATPIPGIPDQKELSKPFKKGPTPIPGIPDDVIKNNPLSNSAANSRNNKNPPQSKSDSNAYSANKPPAERKF